MHCPGVGHALLALSQKYLELRSIMKCLSSAPDLYIVAGGFFLHSKLSLQELSILEERQSYFVCGLLSLKSIACVAFKHKCSAGCGQDQGRLRIWLALSGPRQYLLPNSVHVSSLVSYKALIPLEGLHPHDLITSHPSSSSITLSEKGMSSGQDLVLPMPGS